MLQIVQSNLESSSDSSSSDDEDILEIISALDEEDESDTYASDESEDPAPVLKKQKHSKRQLKNVYFRDILKSSRITSADFKIHFCINRSSFEELLTLISSPEVKAGRPPVPIAEALLITIWVLLKEESNRQVAERFSIGVGHCSRLFHETCIKLTKVASKYIVWPQGDDAHKVINDFNNSHNKLPDVFGCVGTTHIILPLSLSQTDLTYYDYKGNSSIVMQAVCDSKGTFMNINVGSPGSWSNTSIWLKSAVYAKLCENPDFIPTGSYLIGDHSYPLDEFIMVPFDEDEISDDKKKQFNTILECTYSIIFKAFGRLKGLFKRLKSLNVIKTDNVKYITTAASMLHNLSIRDGVVFDKLESPYLDKTEMESAFDTDQGNGAAMMIRLALMNKVLP